MTNSLMQIGHALPADRNPALVYLSRLSKGSVRTQQTALREIALLISNDRLDYDRFPWQLMDYQQVQALRSHLLNLEVYKVATVNRYLSAVRGVLKEAWKLGLMDTDAYMRAVDVENVKSVELPAGRMLSQDEVRALLQVCAVMGGETAQRDLALIALMYVTGMRRSEVCALQVTNYDATTGEVRIVAGKGNKSRTSYIDGMAKRYVDGWLRERGVQPGALFVVVDRRNNLTDKPMNPQTLYDLLQKRAQQAGIASFSPHDLRRTAISRMLELGADISTVAKIVGHSRLDTTRRYDRREEDAKMNVARLHDIPKLGE